MKPLALTILTAFLLTTLPGCEKESQKAILDISNVTQDTAYGGIPDNAFWKQTGGPYGGYVRQICVGKNGLLVAGTENGIYTSKDNGDHWCQIALANKYANAVAIDSGGTIFAGSSDGVYRIDGYQSPHVLVLNSSVSGVSLKGSNIFAGTSNNGVYRSTDNGNNWTQINNGLVSLNVFSVVITNNGNVLAGTGDGMYLSTDNGDSWTKTFQYSGRLAASPNGSVFFATYFGVFRSTNYGASWDSLGLQWIESIGVDFNGNVFAGNVNSGLYRSPDNGSTWTFLPTGFWQVEAITSIESGTIVVGTAMHGFYRSSDNGNSWQEINTGFSNVPIFSLAINNGNVFAGTAYELYHSTDNGTHWSYANLSGSYIRTLTFGSNGYVFAAIDGSGIYRSTNNGGTWFQVYPSTPNVLTVDRVGNVFAGFVGLYSSTDNGNVWSLLGLAGKHVKAIAFSKNDDIYAGASEGVYKSTDGGVNWIKLKSATSTFISLAITDSGYVFAGSGSNYGIYRATVNGDSLEQVLSNNIVTSFAIRKNGEIFAGTSFNGIYRSADNGLSWIQTNDGLTSRYIMTLAIDGNDNIFSGTLFGGVFMSLH